MTVAPADAERSDFAAYRPDERSGSGAIAPIRTATGGDVDALAMLLAVRGGGVEENIERARRLLERLPVLCLAEVDGAPVGWCGAQRVSLVPDADPEWLVAGLTVVPEQRRRGIAARLLGEVVTSVRRTAPHTSVFSVINVRNLASIDLHDRAGFREHSRGATFAGIRFTGGEGVLLVLPGS